MGIAARILVTGDYGIDYDLYLPTDEDNPPIGTPPAQFGVSVGGAGIAYRILKSAESHLTEPADKKPPVRTIEVGFAGNREGVTSPPAAALWQKFKLGKLGKTPNDENTDVWRTRRSLSLGAIAGSQAAPSAKEPPTVAGDFKPRVVLVEDNVGGYRFQVPDWLQTAEKIVPEKMPEWIVLKTSAPICHGAFWWALSRPAESRDRLIVVVSLRDLRSSEIRVSQGISWERTALDLARELSHSPLLVGLRRARHVIVVVHGEGAMWMERMDSGEAKPESHRFTVFFDPGYMEGEWAREICGADGEAYGYQSTFAASVAVHVALSGRDGLQTAIRNGLRGSRLLHAVGHGSAKESNPELPAEALAAVILAQHDKDLPATLPKTPSIDWTKLGQFGSATVPLASPASPVAEDRSNDEAQPSLPGKWRIMEASDRRPSPQQPLYGLGRRVALLGLEALRDVPYASFGKLFTADRDEIEALRNIQRLMQEYENNKSETKPLSISVFGPPGAGKSFAIRQIAETGLRGKKSFLEFNLSQFKDSGDLIGAFHQVRDKVLEGGTPIVFWDEFDSKNYSWLQYLLAPMQDGKFQEGQITHPIGKCIFVFAGATCFDLQSFGPPEKPRSRKAEALKEHKQAAIDFRLKKGPDFKSRLHGNLNVLGPNRRQVFDPSRPAGEEWVDDPTDVCYPVRRAILLRSWLGLMDPRKKQSRERLNIDAGLLAALLEVDHYRHGARSMEKIVAAVKQDGKHGFRRSALPPTEILEMNVAELGQFMEIMDQPRSFQQHAWRLAPAIHAAWFPLGARENAYKTEFDKLPEEAKGDNYAAAVRIPVILGFVGLQLVERKEKQPAVPDVKAILETHLELLAEEEHRAWMDVKSANGWKTAPLPKDKPEEKAQREQRRHHCLAPYKALPESDKEKDRASIRNIPTVAELAKFKIVARKPQIPE